MSRRILLAFCLLSFALLLACSKAENSNTTANGNQNASSNAPTVGSSNPGATAPASSSGPSTAAAGDKIGIAVCDDFIEKYDACVTDKVPAAVRAQYTTMLSQWRDSWKKLSGNPDTRGSLAEACKSAMEQARTQMRAYNCTF